MVSFSSLVQNSLIAFQMVQKQKHTHKSVGRTPGQWSTAHKNHLFALFTEQRKRGLLPQYLQCTLSCLCCQPLPVNIHSPLPHLCGPKTSCRLWLHLCVPTLPDQVHLASQDQSCKEKLCKNAAHRSSHRHSFLQFSIYAGLWLLIPFLITSSLLT